MKKGFTLVELLAVIAILGIIALIAIPAVDRALNQGENQAFETQKAQIIKGAKDFFSMNPQCLPVEEDFSCNKGVTCSIDGDCTSVFVTVDTLQKEGFLQRNIKNPKTNDMFAPSTQIKIEAIGSGYKYTVLEETMSGDNTSEDGPVIVLNGGNIQYVEINTPFVDNGYTAISEYGADITDKVIVSGSDSIRTNELGAYTITYYIDSYNITETKTVMVVDTTKPVISFVDVQDDTVTIEAKDVLTKNFWDYVTISDNSNLPPALLDYSSNVSQIAGNYTVTYTAQDSSGNKATKKLNVNVIKGIKFESREDDADANIHYIDITFPEGEEYINQYSEDLGKTFKTTDNSKITLTIEGSYMVIARMVDSNGNIVMSLSYTV